MPKMRSHEISLALDTRIRELGGDIWYQSEAETILADDAGRIRGVKLTDGKVIETRHVIGTIWELTFRRVDGEAFPFFRAGQYASIQVKIGDSLVSRPYSIVSSPRQALAGELVLAVENAGFVTAKLMEQYADVAASTFFLCGPQAMYDFVEKELAPYGLPKKAVHRDAGCCGFCHSKWLAGEYHVAEGRDGRREADRKFGFIHPCVIYPLSDMEIDVPVAY